MKTFRMNGIEKGGAIKVKIGIILLTILMFCQVENAYAGRNSANEKVIFNYLTNTMGLNSAAACGVMANIDKESSFNPAAYNSWDVNGPSYGICQWHDVEGSGGRFTNLKNFCSARGLNYTSLNAQLQYLDYELNNNYTYRTKVFAKLKSVSNNAEGAYEAAYAWCYYFEVPAGYNTGVSVTRGNYAKSTYWPIYGSGAADAGVTYFPACSSSHTSIVSALQSIGVDSSFSNRSVIASINGITNYSGTAAQNVQMLNLLKQGRLIKSKSAAKPTPATISGQNVPGTLNKGNVFSIRGTVSSGSTLTNVTVGVYDAAGNCKTGKTVNPNSTSYNIYNVDKYILFDKLTAGVYYYRVTAKNSAGTATLVNQPFIVLGNSSTIASGTYNIRLRANTGYGLSILQKSNANEANVHLWTQDSSNYKRYKFTYKGNGYYTIQVVGSKKYLDVKGGGSAAGTNVQQCQGNGTNAQLWQVLSDGTGAYYLIPKCAPTCCLDLADGIITNGQNVRIWTANLSNAQRWKLVRVEDETSTKLDRSSATIYKDTTLQLKATVKGKSTKVTWSTSNSKVATVSSSGKVTAKKAGTVTISAKANGKTAKCTVTVKNPTITLNKTQSTIHVGMTLQLKATVKGKSSKVSWSSSNKRVATVNSSGKVTAKTKGTVTITAKANGKTTKCTVTIKSPTITLNKTKSEMYAGSTLQLKATVKGKSSSVSWSTSNSKIATVSSSGKVTAKKAGKVTITAKANGKTAKCVVTVKKVLSRMEADRALTEYFDSHYDLEYLEKNPGFLRYEKKQSGAYWFSHEYYTGVYAKFCVYEASGNIFKSERNPYTNEYGPWKQVGNAYNYL